MRLRYSLLSMFLITALIAGSVKLWYGPHHVVEIWSAPDWTVEYNYTRDWNEKRMVTGPVVFRQYTGKVLSHFDMRYFRQGIDTRWTYSWYDSQESVLNSMVQGPSPFTGEECPLSEQELRVFHQARDAELQRLAAAGIQSDSFKEGVWYIPLIIPSTQ